jgi:endonuclease/exonuclease/phosphatase family metal-dependent hydrolase
MDLTVATYNVRGFRDGLDRLARIVATFEPDVLLLQETGSREALRRFALATGLDVAADPLSPLRRRAKDAVLVRSPWRIVSHRQHRFAGSARWYPRAVLLARLGGDGGRGMWAASTHLGLSGAERGRHVGELLTVCSSLEGPVLIGGDLNARPDASAVRVLAGRFQDVWSVGEGDGVTLPALRARIDYLFVSGDLAVQRAWVPAEAAFGASDHLPVVAELRP